MSVRLPSLDKDPILADVASEALGISPGMRVIVVSVLDESPAMRAGLKPGDQVLQAQGNNIYSIKSFINLVREHADEGMTLSIKRDGVLINVHVMPENDSEGHGRIGAKMMAQTTKAPVIYHMGLFEGISLPPRSSFISTACR